MRAHEFDGPTAAGCIIVAEDTGRWCLQQRSNSVNDPGVWSTWGGGREPGESVTKTVLRELAEESGYTGPVTLRFVDSNPSYATFMAVVPHEFEPRINSECQDWQWCEPDQLPRPLHPGLVQLLTQTLSENTNRYREIEFVCANPDFCDATDPEQQQQLHQQLRKIPGVIPVYQDQSDYSAGQFSLTAIYQTAAQRRQIMAAARALGVAVDLARPVDDDYVDRALRGELEGQIQENSEPDTAPNIKLEILQHLQQMPLTVFGSAATRDVAQAKDFDVFLDLDANPEHKKYLKPVLNLSYNYYGWIDPFVIKDGVLYVRNDTATGWTRAKNAQAILKNIRAQGRPIDQIQENFADGKVKGKSRPGRVKRAGASCNGSVTDLRARAKKASGERARMYHWCANMKSGKKKK